MPSAQKRGEGGGACKISPWIGPYPQYGWDFPEEIPEKFRKDPGTLSERFLEFPSGVRLGCPKPCNSRHSRLSEHFQNSVPPRTAEGASFFRSGSGEDLSELVMEFPAVLRVSLMDNCSNLKVRVASRHTNHPFKI